MKIVFASSNQGKIREIQALLPRGYEVLGLHDIGISQEIPETGNSIAENSAIKAKHVAEHIFRAGSNYPVFADDSGLEVDILDGAPGVNSARYAGSERNDEANKEKLLCELQNATHRKAGFRTVISLFHDGQMQQFEGRIFGTIAHEPRGHNGFGYDPLFIPQGYRSTFAELKPEIKNAISHRAIAVRKLTDYLANLAQKKAL